MRLLFNVVEYCAIAVGAAVAIHQFGQAISVICLSPLARVVQELTR